MAHHDRSTLPGGELVPEIGSFRHVPAQLPTSPNLAPSRDVAISGLAQFADAFAKIIKVVDAMAAFSRQVARVYGPPVRKLARHAKLHDHRRHQDERRCVAKAGRRERTGWRRSA